MRITVFPTDFNPKLTDKGETAEVADFMALTEITAKQAWSAGVFRDGNRSNAGFLGADLIALDVDEDCTLAEGMEKFKPYAHVIYTTRNHQKVKNPGTPSEKPACDRFRVILRLDRPIATQSEYRLTWQALRKKFPFIDDKCPDPARFFYPGTYIHRKDDGDTVRVVSNLSMRTLEFLRTGAPAGEWNAALFRAAKDLQEQMYTFDQAVEMLEAPAKLDGNYGYLDETDIKTIESAFSKPPKYAPRLFAPVELDENGEVIGADFETLAREIIDSHFVNHVSVDLSRTYRITNLELQEVEPCPNRDLLVRHVAGELRKYPASKKIPTPNELINYWKTNGAAIEEEPRAVAWPGEDVWTIKRLLFTPTSGAYPAWQEFLGRLSDAEAFMAFVWSCLEMRSKSRQALWLYGPHGQDGKSTVIRAIASLLGRASGALSNNQISSGSRFTLSNFYNKRLVVYPDAKNTAFPMSELFRNLTSGDMVPIEFKGEGIINAVLYVKLLIASNSAPDISASNADSSRVIRIDVEKSSHTDDPEWEEKLERELPHFLHACKEAYEELCPNHGQIRVNDVTKELVRDSAENFQELYEVVFQQHFELGGEEDKVSAVEFYDKLRRANLTDREIGRFKDYLRDRYKISLKRVTEIGDRKRVYSGIRVKRINLPSGVHKH